MSIDNPPQRKTVTQEVTTVRFVATPFGRDRINPPCLGQLREFVAACNGLDEFTSVSIEKGHLDEGGRTTYTFSVRIVKEGS